MARIFLCHASEDKAAVRDVYRRLCDIEGIEPWLDEEDLLPGQDWTREIPRALKAAEFILIFLSQNSVAKRGYVQREMKLALDALQEVPEGTIHTIPVRLDECSIPEPLQRYHYANLFDARGFERLVRAIRAGLSQRQPEESTEPAQGVVIPAPPQDAPVVQQKIEEAERQAGPALAPRLTNSIGMEFVLIPSGTFLMGSDDAELEQPAHQVTISQPFYLGAYEVTQGQWNSVMEANPSWFKGGCFTLGLNLPVERVSWKEMQEFIQRLNAKEGGARYHLPTEAEWEYACRAGSTTRYSFGDDPSQLDAYGWYGGNSGRTTHPVGERKPNAWGLYDMHGNVWEWVQDWWGKYAPEPVTDPQGPESGSYGVVRGGGCSGDAGYCRSAYRLFAAPSDRTRYESLGFRLLREAR